MTSCAPRIARIGLGLSLLGLGLLGACAGADPELAPRASETVAGGVTALVPREGLAYLTARALAESPGLREVQVDVARGAVPVESGGSIIHGQAHGVIPVESVRLEPDEQGTALRATARLGPAELSVPILRRPALGAPERCHLRMSTAGGLGVVELLPAVGPVREIQAVGPATLDLRETDTALDADCPAPVPEHEADLSALLDRAVAQAVASHLAAVAQAVAAAAGPSQPWSAGARTGAGLLLAALTPSRSGSPVRVRTQGLARVYDVAVEGQGESGCAPTPHGEAPAAAAIPAPPVLGPDGAAYRLALALDGAFIDRAIAWAAASGVVCQDEGPDGGLPVSDASELRGVETLVTGGRPLRTRLRPGGGVRTSLRPGDRAPLRLTLPRLGLAVYGDVDGAPLALARLVADVVVEADVRLGQDGGLRLAPVAFDVQGAQAAPTVLPGGVDDVIDAGPGLYARAVERLLERLSVPLDGWTDRAAEFVAAAATESHLMVYLDLR